MQVRTQTLVKGAIIQIAADPFAQVRHPPRSSRPLRCVDLARVLGRAHSTCKSRSGATGPCRRARELT